MNTLLQPLVAIVLLWVMLRLPIHLAKVAMLGAAPLGGGFASRAVSYAAGSQLRDTARQHLPAWAGGQPTSGNEQPAQAESRTGTRLRQAATLAGASATGGATGAAAAAGGGGASAGNARARAGRPRSTATTSATGGGMGARTRRRRPRRPTAAGQAVAGRAADSELSRAGLRQRDVRGQVPRAHQPRVRRAGQGGASVLPADTQRGIGQLVSEHGAGRARAPRLPGARRMVTAGARSAAHARRRQPRDPRPSAQRHADTGDQHDGWTPAGATDQGAAGEQQRSSAPFGATQPASTPQPPSTGSPGQPQPVDVPDAGAPPGQGRSAPPREPGDGLSLTARGGLIGCAPRQLILSRSFGSGI